MQKDIQSSHTNREEIFFEQENSMGDRDDRNTGQDQENVMSILLDTFQEQNRKMDMRLQLMARQMGINIEDLYVALVQEVVDSLGGNETVMWMFQQSE